MYTYTLTCHKHKQQQISHTGKDGREQMLGTGLFTTKVCFLVCVVGGPILL